MAVQTPAPPSTDLGEIGIASPSARGSSVTRALNWLEAQAMFVVGLMTVLIVGLASIPTHLAQDGWLALAAGRVVAGHGIPQYDYLTAMAHGAHWVDQQWLTQLLMYELTRHLGIAGMTVIYVAITTAAFALAMAAARSLGAQPRHILFVIPASGLFYLATAVSIRTQGFAYPLFIAVLWLLAAEFTRAPGASGADRSGGHFAARLSRMFGARRVYLVFPVLILWANIHGSVTMGVGLAVLYGLVVLLQGVRRRGLVGFANRRGWAFVLLAPLTLLATPYGTGMVHYYTVTLMNPEFGRLVTEWRPVTGTPVLAVPLALLFVGTAWVLFRSRRTLPLFDLAVLLLLAGGAVDAVRNITWFGLAVLVLLPPAISRMKRDQPAPLRRARVNLVLASITIVAAIAALLVVVSRPTAWFENTYPRAAVAEVDRLVAATPGAKVFADVRYADWLVWHQPELGGRVAYDTSLELLTQRQLAAISLLTGAPTRASLDALRPYEIWVLNPGNKRADRVILRQPGVRVITRNKRVIIAVHRSRDGE